MVDIHISVYDVLRTMKLAENYTSLYAIVGFPSITEPAHTLCSLLNFDLDILTVRSAEEVRHTLERLKQGGYRMVVCDMVTHTIAREMGFDAFLITSGIESLHSAIDQAVNISTWFGQLRQENLFLRSITQEQGGRVVVMEPDGSLYYNNMKDISPELHRCLQTHLREIPATGSLKFYYTERSQLYSITAQVLLMNNVQRYLFYCVPSRIPLHSNRPGLRSLNKGECEYLFSNSFYSLSGAMGTQDAEINALAAVRQPLFICGEPGTGKEQIARYLYLHSALVNRPLVVANCALMNDKSWDFLLNHYNSPLNANGNTVYFQNFEAIPEQWSAELLAAIEETGLARRVRLLFSRSVRPEEPVSPVTRRFIERLGALTLELPPLRSRSDEIPSLSSLYLNSLNLELGKQISGFEPRAIEMLRQYPWPNNYTQFKNLLRSLATLTNGPYIRSSSVADLLSKERSLRSAPAAHPAAVVSTDTSRTLESIIGEVVQQTVAAHGGNRAAAARQLGISRTTLWRYLGKIEAGGAYRPHLMLLTLNGFVFGASYGAPKERFSKTCSLHPSDAVQGLGCSPTSILQRKNGIYIRVKTPLVSTMRLLKTPPKFDNHFARMIVRFQAQLEADGCFSARKSSEFAFRCKQNELSSPLFLPRFPSFFLAICRK